MTNYTRLKVMDKLEYAYWIAECNEGCEYNASCPACKVFDGSCKGKHSVDECADLWLNWLSKKEIRRNEQR